MVISQLALLESAGLIRLGQVRPELEYVFQHAMIQEAAYESLLRADRRALHRQVARALEQNYPHRLGELAPILARHYEESGEDRQALDYYTRAGDESMRRYANAEAVMHYTQALSICRRMNSLQPDSTLPVPPHNTQAMDGSEAGGNRLAYLFLVKGRALELSTQYAATEDHYIEMERFAHERNDHALELNALNAQATLYSTPTPLFNPTKGEEISMQALGLARTLGDKKSEARILWNLLLVHFFSNQHADARRFGEESLRIARQLNLREQLGYILSDLADYVYVTAGEFGQALTGLEEAISIFREIGDVPMWANSLTSMAFTQLLMGEFEKSVELTEQSYELSQTAANQWGQAYSLVIRGYAYFELGEIDEAVYCLNEAVKLSSGGFVAGYGIATSLLSILHGFMGNIDHGLEIARLAVSSAELHAPFWLINARSRLARLNILAGNLGEAEEILDRLHQDYDLKSLSSSLAMDVPLADCELELAKGDYERVIDFADDHLAAIDSRQARLNIPYSLFYKGKALLSLKRFEDSKTILTEAIRDAERRKSRFAEWRILATLADVEEMRGDPESARSYREQARQLITCIAENAKKVELQASFLELPDVKAILEAS